MTEKVCDAIAEFLERHDIRHVFGIIGAGNASIFDAIGRRGFTEIICVHHEQAATMAMQTYYRVRGKATAAILTTGGGSTNGVTGVVSAWMDSMPGLVISGNENSRFTRPENTLRIWGVQGYDSSEMVRGVTKYAKRVTDPTRVVDELETAYRISTTGRPGPVWLDIPMDVSAAPYTAQASASSATKSDKSSSGTLAAKELAAQAAVVVDKIRAAKRPVLWLGNGIRIAGAADQVERLLELIKAPTLVSWAGIDLIDSSHPLVYGRAGVYGQRSANFVLQNSDLVVAIGTRLAIPQVGYALDEFAREAELVVVDVDETELKKHGERVAVPVLSDAAAFIGAMFDAIGNNHVSAPQPWIDQCNSYREHYPWVEAAHADQPPFINSYQVMDRLIGHFKDDQVIVTDAGTALLSGHQALKLKNGQRLMTSTGLGEMGYGLPAAIGASFARDRGEVLCLNCDGGMMMNLQELQTVVHHKLPIKLVIFNNDGYLMIKHTQQNLFSGRRVGVDKISGVSCPDYSKVAQAFNIPSLQIRTWDDFEQAIPKMQQAEGPVICEVFMHPDQLFLPKLSLAPKPDGSIVSPPLEDLSPLLPRDEMRKNMTIGLHPKSESL